MVTVNSLFKKKFSLKHYLKAKHIQWCYDTFNVQSVADTHFERNGLVRNSVIKAPNLLACLLLLQENNDFISTMPERLAQKVCKQFGLTIKPIPFHCPEAVVSIFWPKEYHRNAAIQWLLNKARETANKLIDLNPH